MTATRPSAVEPAGDSADDFADFDYYYRENEGTGYPERTWAAMRACPGLPRSEVFGGYRILARYEEICDAERDPETFSSAEGTTVADKGYTVIPIDLDGEEHQSYRRILNPSFSPQRIRGRRAELRSFARDLLAEAVRADGFDFCEVFSRPFPQQTALRLIGFPDSDRARISGWVDDMVRGGDDPEMVAASTAKLAGRILEMAAEYRARPVDESLLSILVHAEIDGAPIGDAELANYVTLLFFGGIDTTSSAIAGALRYLLEHPEEAQRLRTEPELVRTAAEEFIRWTTPVQGQARTVRTGSGSEVSVAGCPLNDGDKVFLLFASGNRDGSVFADPENVVLDRSPNRHLGFGMGPHRCIGSHLARLMVEIALEESLDALVGFEVDPTREITWMSSESRGISGLPLRRRKS